MLTARLDVVGVLESCRWLLLKMSFSLRRERKGGSDQGMNDEWKEHKSLFGDVCRKVQNQDAERKEDLLVSSLVYYVSRRVWLSIKRGSK